MRRYLREVIRNEILHRSLSLPAALLQQLDVDVWEEWLNTGNVSWVVKMLRRYLDTL